MAGDLLSVLKILYINTIETHEKAQYITTLIQTTYGDYRNKVIDSRIDKLILKSVNA